MSIELGFTLAVCIVVGGAWLLTGVMAYLRHRSNEKPPQEDFRHA
ncbi:MAG: hypothetical protein Q8O33_09585 [Pseudomonadota bacterium]|nr:hypothetical protein [Pseudomonadota bacterium]